MLNCTENEIYIEYVLAFFRFMFFMVRTIWSQEMNKLWLKQEENSMRTQLKTYRGRTSKRLSLDIILVGQFRADSGYSTQKRLLVFVWFVASLVQRNYRGQSHSIGRVSCWRLGGRGHSASDLCPSPL